VFTDIDPDPTANWVSLDCLWMWTGDAQVQPTVPNTDLGVMQTTGPDTWAPYNAAGPESITPTIELDYADGASQGQGYIQGFGVPDPGDGWVNPKPISGNAAVREVFTVSGTSRTVTSVSARVNRTSGTSPLTMSVLASDGVTVLASGTTLVPEGGLPTASSNGSSWNTVTFTSPLTLTLGTQYYLLLSSPADTVHTAHALQSGVPYGYLATTVFGDGYCQFNDGSSGWVGWDMWGIPNRTDCDLQFYFTTQ
jgi:hypothetical protein